MGLLWIDRVFASFKTWPKKDDVIFATKALLTQACVALPFGLQTKFLQLKMVPLRGWLPYALVAFFAPALAEETIFRAALLPHPDVDDATSLGPNSQLLHLAVSVAVFVLYHLSPLHKPKELFRDVRFLTLATVLGVTCGMTYLHSGSVWASSAVHHVTGIVWVLLLGGHEKLRNMLPGAE